MTQAVTYSATAQADPRPRQSVVAWVFNAVAQAKQTPEFREEFKRWMAERTVSDGTPKN